MPKPNNPWLQGFRNASDASPPSHWVQRQHCIDFQISDEGTTFSRKQKKVEGKHIFIIVTVGRWRMCQEGRRQGAHTIIKNKGVTPTAIVKVKDFSVLWVEHPIIASDEGTIPTNAHTLLVQLLDLALISIIFWWHHQDLIARSSGFRKNNHRVAASVHFFDAEEELSTTSFNTWWGIATGPHSLRLLCKEMEQAANKGGLWTTQSLLQKIFVEPDGHEEFNLSHTDFNECHVKHCFKHTSTVLNFLMISMNAMVKMPMPKLSDAMCATLKHKMPKLDETCSLSLVTHRKQTLDSFQSHDFNECHVKHCTNTQAPC